MADLTTVGEMTAFGQRQVKCYTPRPATVTEMFETAVQRFGARTAVAHDDERLSYEALHQKVDALARALLASGLERGARVALLLDNGADFLISVLGCMRAAMIAVPMNVRQSPRETEFILQRCDASVLICDREHCDLLPPAEATPALKTTLYSGATGPGSFDQFLSDAPASADFPELHEEDCVCLLFTSGTTGQPKGAMLTHLGIVHSMIALQSIYGLNEEDCSILAVPASHATGLLLILLGMATCGGKSVIMTRFKARPFLELASREHMSFVVMVPAMYNLCLLEPDIGAFDLSAWRIASFGGAPMPPATIEKMARLIPSARLCNIYGATETTSPATMISPDDFQGHGASVGKAVPCADIVVVDENGAPVPVGEVGELNIGGPMVVPGYWDNPAANASEFDAQGRWRSGDLGYVDDKGFHHIVDRRKDIINRGGYKIYSIEVEAILARHDQVIEAALVGYADPVLGERACAFVYSGGAAIDTDALITFCKGLLSSYKIPDRIILTDTPLPRNANGKILKSDLRMVQPDAG